MSVSSLFWYRFSYDIAKFTRVVSMESVAFDKLRLRLTELVEGNLGYIQVISAICGRLVDASRKLNAFLKNLYLS
jgi:hypothetical protein